MVNSSARGVKLIARLNNEMNFNNLIVQIYRQSIL